jgi:hypothetical protein
LAADGRGESPQSGAIAALARPSPARGRSESELDAPEPAAGAKATTPVRDRLDPDFPLPGTRSDSRLLAARPQRHASRGPRPDNRCGDRVRIGSGSVFAGCLSPSLADPRRPRPGRAGSVVGTRRERARYAETLKRWREHVNCDLTEVRALGSEARFERTRNGDHVRCDAGFGLGTLRDAFLRRRGGG